MKKKAYTLNTDKKIITIDDTVKKTTADEQDILFYANAGYIIKHKSKARQKAAISRSDATTLDQIITAMSGDKVALAKIDQIKADKGFFGVQKYYREWLAANSEKAAAESGNQRKRPGRKPGRKPKIADPVTAEGDQAEGQAAMATTESED